MGAILSRTPRVLRRLRIFRTAIQVYLSIRLTRARIRRQGLIGPERDEAWSQTHTRCATRILRASISARGLWIKCCQYAASRADTLPDEYITILSKCLDACPPTSAEEVTCAISAELSPKALKIEDVFEGFDANAPIASASIAQVHRARLKGGGKEVVIKIQHPGIEEMLLTDLRDLTTIVNFVAGQEPEYDLRPVLQAWVEMVPKEVDFLNEQSNMEVMRKMLCEAPKELRSNAYVPAPLPELSTRRMLVMEYIDGCKITDKEALLANKVNAEKVVTEITKAFGLQLHITGVFNGDPHPGNLLVHKLSRGGQAVLLDFGICVHLTDEERYGFSRLILAAADSDSYSLLQSFADVGIKLNRADPSASLDSVRFLFRTTSPREQSKRQAEDFVKRMKEHEEKAKASGSAVAVDHREEERSSSDAEETRNNSSEQMGMETMASTTNEDKKFKRNPVDAYPGDLVFLFRSIALLRGLATQLEVTHAYLPVLRRYAERALLESCPEDKTMKYIVHPPATPSTALSPVVRARSLAAIEKLTKVLEELYEKNLIIGMQVCAYKDGQKVLDMAAGRVGRYNMRPVKPNSLFNSFSTTKGVAALLFARIQDEYGVAYEDPVGKYWPEYATNGKEDTTIAHILSHTAGLARILPKDMSMVRVRDDWRGIIDFLAAAKPSQTPGEKFEYHALSFGWLVAGLVEKISGKTLQEHLEALADDLSISGEMYCGNMPAELTKDSVDSHVVTLTNSLFKDAAESISLKRSRSPRRATRPEKVIISPKRSVTPEKASAAERDSDMVLSKAGMMERTLRALKDAGFLLANENQENYGENTPEYLLDPTYFNHPVLRAGFMPSANGHFTARALATIYGALANDGILKTGQRIFSTKRVVELQKPLLDEGSGTVGPAGHAFAWAAGLSLYDVVDKDGVKKRHGAIGHGGIGGSMAFAIPEHKFSVAVTVNQLNLVSSAAAMAISETCKAFDVPQPVWFAR